MQSGESQEDRRRNEVPPQATTASPTHADTKRKSFLGKVVAGKYKIVDVLGQGGFGAVFLVEITDGMVGEKLAMKVVHPKFSRDAEAHARFRNEVKVAMKIVHPYVVQIRDVGTTADGLLYYTMDYCPGNTLGRLLREHGKLTCRASYNVIRKVLRALSTAHELGIIHRDLKPANILIVKERGKDAVRILDFGIATSIRQNAGVNKGLGSLHYMPPEQFKGEQTGRYSDLYAVGVILYRCLTGRKPQEGKTAQEVYNGIMTVRPPPLEAFTREVSRYEGLQDVVFKAIAAKPEDRYQSARGFCKDLIEIFRRDRASSDGVKKRRRLGWKRLFFVEDTQDEDDQETGE